MSWVFYLNYIHITLNMNCEYLLHLLQCNHPVYAGNGVRCGLDSDSDGYPDVQLDCEGQHCMKVYFSTCNTLSAMSYTVLYIPVKITCRLLVQMNFCRMYVLKSTVSMLMVTKMTHCVHMLMWILVSRAVQNAAQMCKVTILTNNMQLKITKITIQTYTQIHT